MTATYRIPPRCRSSDKLRVALAAVLAAVHMRCNAVRMNHSSGPPKWSPGGGRDESIERTSDPYRAGDGPLRITALRSTSRWIYLGLAALGCLGFCAAVGLWIAAAFIGHQNPDPTLMKAGVTAFVVTIFVVYVHVFVGVYWLYCAWEWLPPDQRYNNHWRGWISPAQAALLLLVPYFHYYWMFIVNCGLCDAIDRMRVQHPTREPAPKNLAIAACVCQILLPVPAGAIMWFIFMSKIERLTREMSGETPAVHATAREALVT
jgi:hypothetical protein